ARVGERGARRAAGGRRSPRRLAARPDDGRRRIVERGNGCIGHLLRRRSPAPRRTAVTTAMLLDALPDPVVRLDADRCIVDANEAAGRLAGTPADQLVGRALSEVF